MNRCPHRLVTGAPCAGNVLATGYCDTCGQHEDAPPLPPLADHPCDNGPEGLLQLPLQQPSSPEDRLQGAEARLPTLMKCSSAECGTVFLPPYVSGAVPPAGRCPRCRTPYSYEPDLDTDEDTPLLDGQYQVIGVIARGGQGWVYLARDLHLDEYVAIKGLLNRYEENGPAQADKERRDLTAIRHPRIVRIRNFVRRYDPADPRKLTGAYIVMEDVGDRTLEAVIDATRRGEFVLDVEHVLTYGVRILEALEHLHAMGSAYMDMKPSNVVHHEDSVKVIDLGALRDLDIRHPELVRTRHYASPEIDVTHVPTVAHDIHTVGATLGELAAWAVGDDVPGLGTASFRAVLARATASDAGRRFATAKEMADQLLGALREIRALRGKRDQPRPSACFTPAPHLLGARLGTVPQPEHWTARPLHPRERATDAPLLGLGTPAPAEVARGLPVPVPHEDDPQKEWFGVSTYDPARYQHGQPDPGRPSVEVCLHNVRVRVAEGTPRALDDACEQLDAADSIPGERAVRAWRLEWHRGLIALGRGDLPRAWQHFTEVYRALPGEYAAKLALAHCAELLGPEAPLAPATPAEPEAPMANRLYQAVHLRNPSHGGAALGLARLALAEGDRAGALAVLDHVPETSRHRSFVRIAVWRIRAGRLADGLAGLPAPEETRAVLDEVRAAADDPVLPLSDDDVLRLRTELLEWRLDTLRAWHDATGARWWRRMSPEELSVREQLEGNYRRLAQQRLDREEFEHLIDLSHAVRPPTRF
ncbi:tetratricopeptide repeat protein [Streptomyces sp. NPDC021093]|uniref:tetratricopeptide repeat protein n=1 Tax=Streptomyces sp. NPDC021093 TaxID=3365112 RepID=UPI0037B7DC57